MAWIKRNLYFVIGAVIALVLLGIAGWYFYSQWDLNNKTLDQLNQSYADLAGFNKLNPHPGSGTVNNIQEAKEQQQELRAFLQKARQFFQKIDPIPDVPKLSDRDFSAALSRTIDQLRRDAVAASVTLPPDYSFSFQSQRQKVSFDPKGLKPLAIELGEVRSICNVLFQAKVNSLDYLRRERTTDDAAGNATDYLVEKSVTNELAVLAPYELTFRCFSPELASVLSGFASSPNGLVVKTINVEAASASTTEATAAGATGTPGAGVAPPGPPIPTRPGFVPPAGTAPGAIAIPGAHGLPIVLDEKQLRVTISLVVIKPTPPPAGK
jgi:hypothetical protein